MTLHLSADHQSQIIRAGEAAYPRECCGVLLGILRSGKGHRENHGDGAIPSNSGAPLAWVTEVHAVENAWVAESNERFDGAGAQETAERRFTIDPRDLLKIQRAGRDHGFDIIGVYHSHPNHPAIPSDFDRTYAWTQYSYPIVAVHRGKAVDLRSWRLDDSGQFQPEDIRPAPTQQLYGTPSVSNGPPNE